MPVFPFVGPSYKYRSIPFDAQRSVNMYPVKSETGDSKAISGMEGTPGKQSFLTFPKFPGRGGIQVNGRSFCVAGNGFYEIFADGSYTERGTINTTSGAVSIATNGNQVCVVDNPDGYIFDLATDTLTQITDPYYLGAIAVIFDGGYFVFIKPDSQIYFISNLYDGLIGNALDFASAEGSPDNLVGIAAVHQQVWLFGSSTVQVVQNSGGADFPYTSVAGSLIQYGCAATYAISQTANVVIWVGEDNDGNAMVWQATGYQPLRISTHAIEYYLQQYSASMEIATTHTYQEDGHYFYCLSVPGMPTTLVFDIELQQWHERGYWSEGEYSRDRASFHIFSYGKHLVGDYETGDLYDQSLNYYTDNGQYIRRLRTAPYISDDLEYIYFKSFQLDLQAGVGTDGLMGGAFDSGFDTGFDIDQVTDPNQNPLICLRWSDNGFTWSNEYFVSIGKIGQYNTRALWRRLGRSRSRTFEVSYSPATKVFWIAAHIMVEKGNN